MPARRNRLAVAAFAALPLVALAQAPSAPAPARGRGTGIDWSKEVVVVPSGEWKGPRLADGQPDVTGHWSNTIANHSNWTDPQAGPPGEPSAASKLPRDQRAPSRVSDPADGQVPYLPAARALQEEFARNFSNPTKPQYIEPLARCAPGGVPKSFIWHGYEIRQYPGYVLFLFNSGSRIVRLDGKPHLPASIKLWNADSRGHWEGNTLVVDVSNNNAKALFGRTGDFASENVHIVERYSFANDGKSYTYVARFEDPTVYSRPWSATIPARRYTEADTPGQEWHYEAKVANRPGKPVLHERMERICVENNGPFGGGAIGVPSNGPIIDR
jgi:hypothetical protein